MTADLSCRAEKGTECLAHTRAYKDGELVAEGFDVALVSDYLDDDHVVWLDLEKPTLQDLEIVREELSLHDLALEDAVAEHQRPKLDHYENFEFLSAMVARLDERAELTLHEVDAFITTKALVTVRKSAAAISALNPSVPRTYPALVASRMSLNQFASRAEPNNAR